MKKSNKLKLPLWADLIYLLLTIVAPIIFIVVEAMKVPSGAFKITFTVFCTILITYIFIRKFLLNKYMDKIQSQCATLELNYQTGVGDAEATKQLWVKNKLIDYFLSIASIILMGVIVLLLVWGIQSLGMKLKGTMLFICILYVVAVVFRVVLMLITFVKKSETKEE